MNSSVGRTRPNAKRQRPSTRSTCQPYLALKGSLTWPAVCAGRFNPNNRAASRTLPDSSTSFLVKFNANGSGEWLPLVLCQGPLTVANGFMSQADVLMRTR